MTDRTRLRAIGAWAFYSETGRDTYLLASRRVNELSGLFSVYYVTANGLGTMSLSVWKVDSDGSATGSRFGEMGFRPVFILASDVKVLRGEGTEDSPFEIGL